jgi:hypothetical protein
METSRSVSAISNFKEDVEALKTKHKEKLSKIKRDFERKIYLKNKNIDELNK